MDNKNLPAYPNTGSKDITVGDLGLSKREMIAAMCLQGMLTNPHIVDVLTKDSETWVIEKSTELADGLLTHLEKTNK